MYCKYCGEKVPNLPLVVSAPEAEWSYAFCTFGCAYKFLGNAMGGGVVMR